MHMMYEDPAAIPPEELFPFTQDVIFSLVMQNPQICLSILKLFLPEQDFYDLHIEANPLMDKTPDGESVPSELANFLIETQQTIQFGPKNRSVRLDVSARTSHHRIAVEMQTYAEPYIGRRSRYYHSSMDTKFSQRGDDYSDLPVNYVIFFCTSDPFRKAGAEKSGKHMYFFQMRDVENHLILDEDRYTILVNAACALDRVPERLRPLYAYMQNPAQVNGDKLVGMLDREVRKFNTTEWRTMHMTLGEKMDRQYEMGMKKGEEKGEKKGITKGIEIGEKKGITKGIEIGEKRGVEIGEKKGIETLNSLYKSLSDDNRTDDLLRAMHDPDYRDHLLKEFEQ